MSDVFGGLAGSPAEPPAGRTVEPEALEGVLDGARLWGLELDPRFRVLAATLEPAVDRYAWGVAADRRVQVLCYPVSTILGSFRRDTEGGRELLKITEEHLVDVVAAFDGPTLHSPLFKRPEPRPGEWAPELSLAGRSSAPDGTRTTLTLSVQHEDLSLDVFVRFDEIQVKGPDGTDLGPPI